MQRGTHVRLIRVQGFEKVAAHVHHAPDLGQPARGFEECVVDRIGVGLQVSGVSFQKFRRSVPPACRRVVVESQTRRGS